MLAREASTLIASGIVEEVKTAAVKECAAVEPRAEHAVAAAQAAPQKRRR
jgi:hypothetical protein